MTRLDYDLVRENNPGLELPGFGLLRDGDKERLKTMTAEELIASRTAVKLIADHFDRWGYPVIYRT